MANIAKQSTDVLLSVEQLKKLEEFQSGLADIQTELESYVDEFAGIIDRHYFNRENDFLEDQQKNLREVVILQSRFEKAAESLATGSKELKSFMMQVQKSVQGDFTEEVPSEPEETGEAAATAAPKAEEEKEPAAAGKPEDEKSTPAAPAEAEASPPKAGKLKDTPMVIRGPAELMDENTTGGEISIKCFIDELGLKEPKNHDTLYQINNQLKELLYNRKLIGYGATTMVFGRDKTLVQLFEDLQPIFLSDAVRELLVENRYVDQGELDKLKLACNNKRELIYLVA